MFSFEGGGGGMEGGGPEEAVDSRIVPFYFHMPIKKDGVSGIISRWLHCAEEEMEVKEGACSAGCGEES